MFHLAVCAAVAVLAASLGTGCSSKSSDVADGTNAAPAPASSVADKAAVAARINAINSNPNIPPQLRQSALKTLQGSAK